MQKMYYLLLSLLKLLPIARKKIIFMSYYGSQYGCNPKYLSEYIVRTHKDWDVVWAFTNPKEYNVAGVRKVRYRSLRYFYELYTSKVLITNYRMTADFQKRRGQYYIQTWHSSLRLKKIEKDTEATLPANYVKMAKKDSCNIDALLSGCEYSTLIFKGCFWYAGQILPTGTPRNDLLFDNNNERKENIKRKLNVSPDVHLLLYAPTFRKGNVLDSYNIDYERLVCTLKKYKDGDWLILVRLHPHLRNMSKEFLKRETNVLDVTTFDDIQELLYVADVVISDYSSLIFDFAITLRPCFLYMPDLNSYLEKDRCLYFDINSLPFPISKDNETLRMQIESLDTNKYADRIKRFLCSIGSYETGHASENVVRYIENTIKK